MNDVQLYTPPRFLALCLGGLIFVLYQLGWRDVILSNQTYGDPVTLPLSISLSLLIGYGLAMLWWLIARTKGQVWETLRPTRGRIFGAICLAMVAPLTVLSWVPWIFIGLMPFVVTEAPLWAAGVTLASVLAAYPLAAMIVRHTYHRRWLRFGLFCLCFWTAYAAHLLVFGVRIFQL